MRKGIMGMKAQVDFQQQQSLSKENTCPFPFNGLLEGILQWLEYYSHFLLFFFLFYQLVLLERSFTIEFLTAAKINSLQLSGLISYLGFYHLTFFPSHLISAFTWMSSCWKSITENYVEKKIMLLSAPDAQKWAEAQYFFLSHPRIFA